MLIDQQFRKSVALLCVDVGTRRIAAGTAFFVGVPIASDAVVPYVVTALHCVYAARPFGPLHLRLNLRSELVPHGAPGFVDLPLAPDAWIEHPTTDVAIARMPALTQTTDWLWIPQVMIASAEYVSTQGVGVGDEVFFAGLFSQHPGLQRFQPIVRFGNISMMPHEKVSIEVLPGVATEVDAYLIEARSWGGHSGSPTFIYYPPDRRPGVVAVGGPAPALLGLVSAHYPVPNEPEAMRDSLDSTQGSPNAGIAVVVLAQAILDLLNAKELVTEREEAKKQVAAGRPSPRADSSLPHGYTRKSFLSDLEKATKPLPEGEKPDPTKP